MLPLLLNFTSIIALLSFVYLCVWSPKGWGSTAGPVWVALQVEDQWVRLFSAGELKGDMALLDRVTQDCVTPN